MKLNFLAFKLILLVHLILLVWPNLVWAEKVLNVLIVASSNDEPYQKAIAGFKDELRLKLKVSNREVFLTKKTDQNSLLTAMISESKPDLIFSLGGDATDAVIKNTSKIPIVATMILKRFSENRTEKITGVYLNYPLSVQFTWLKKFFPEQRKVAIFFNRKENDSIIHDAQNIAENHGIILMPIPVESPKELPYALDQLKNNIEVLLAIPDEIAMSGKTAKEVLLASFRNRVPLVGLSDNWVKSGALYALSWDYEDLGRQCAIQSDKLTKGTPLKSVPFEHPRKTTYSINAKIAEHMNMEIPQALLKNALHVFNDDGATASAK
jgi:putative tryptophan/tyrosine transport system substrate-binding protein